MTDRKRREAANLPASRTIDSDRHATPAIQLPKPTEDQKTYLDEIERRFDDYDPEVVIGGPRDQQG